MVLPDVREFLAERNPLAIVFDNPSFDRSIIGIDATNDVVVYSFDKMIVELAEDDGISEEEALDFIEYNTLRTLPYIDSSSRPIIVDDFFFNDTMGLDIIEVG